MANVVVVGSQWGDEGKGKIVDWLSERADVVVLRADRPNIAPVNDPIGAVVWGMDTSNIDWVFVGGSPLVEKGENTSDLNRARDLAMAALGNVATATAKDPS